MYDPVAVEVGHCTFAIPTLSVAWIYNFATSFVTSPHHQLVWIGFVTSKYTTCKSLHVLLFPLLDTVLYQT